MAARLDLRTELAVGRNALDPGRVPLIAEWLSDRPRSVSALIQLLWDDEPGVANRAADVLERITREPSPPVRRAVERFKVELIGRLSDAPFAKLRWNLALTIPRLPLTVLECRRVVAILQTWLDDPSSIVKTAALHGMAELTSQDPESLPEILDVLRLKGRSGTPAMRARSRILLQKLERGGGVRRPRGNLNMYD